MTQNSDNSSFAEATGHTRLTNPSPGKNRKLFSNGDLKEDLNRRTIRGGAAAMAGEIASSVLRIGSTVVLARLLLPDDFGLVSMVTAITVFAERFKDLGLSDATVQNRQIDHAQISGLFWLNLIVCLCIAGLLSILSRTIARFYNEPRLVAISLVVASTFVFSGLVIQHQAILRRQLRFGALALIQLSSMVLSLITAIVLGYLGFGYWALVAREFSNAIFFFIGTWIACPWRPGLPKRKVGLTSMLSFARNVTGFNVVHFLARNVDKILLGKLYGAFWVGLYDNAFKLIAMPVNQIRYPVQAVALPALSALQAEPAEFRLYYEKMSRLLIFFSMPIVVFAIVFADMIIELLLGPHWTKSLPLFRVLAVGGLIEPFAHLIGASMMAYGKTKEYFRLGLLSAGFLVACVVVGAILWGPIGVAIGSAAAVYFGTVLSLTYGLKHTPVIVKALLPKLASDSLVTLFWGALLCGIRYIVGWSLQPQWLFVFLIGGVVVYIGLWLVIPGGKERLSQYYGYARHVFTARKK